MILRLGRSHPQKAAHSLGAVASPSGSAAQCLTAEQGGAGLLVPSWVPVRGRPGGAKGGVYDIGTSWRSEAIRTRGGDRESISERRA
jgi:hypothetical protein